MSSQLAEHFVGNVSRPVDHAENQDTLLFYPIEDKVTLDLQCPQASGEIFTQHVALRRKVQLPTRRITRRINLSAVRGPDRSRIYSPMPLRSLRALAVMTTG